MKKLISIIVPVLNEEHNISFFYDNVNKAIQPLEADYEFEFVFTDNHSTDKTFSLLKELANHDGRIRAYRFTRNFGFQRSIYTGYMKAKGEAAIQLDCDLQDPPELIKDFIAKWEEGYKVVYGVRVGRKESKLFTWLRKAFYRLIDFICEYKIPHDAGDFRLIDRCIIEQLKMAKNASPYLRGEIANIGFKQIGIPYHRNSRIHGESKFTLGGLAKLAYDGMVGHSIMPLRFATYISLFVSLITIILFFSYLISRIFFSEKWPPGFATTILLILFSLSLITFILGIMGEYLGRIYNQVVNRPIIIIEDEV